MAGKRINLEGMRFGKLTVMEFHGRQMGHSLWLCRCDCGGEAIVRANNLRSGNSTSCGCEKTRGLKYQKEKKP